MFYLHMNCLSEQFDSLSSTVYVVIKTISGDKGVLWSARPIKKELSFIKEGTFANFNP